MGHLEKVVYGKPYIIKQPDKRYAAYRAEQGEHPIDVTDCTREFEELPHNEDDKTVEAQDPLIVIDVGDSSHCRSIFISALLEMMLKFS